MSLSNEFHHLYRKGIEYHKAGNHIESIEAFEKALDINPKDGRTLYVLANVLADVNRKVDAIHRYNEAIEIDPNITSLWYNKGNTHLELKELDNALHSYEQSIKIKPDYYEAWYNKGITLTEMGKIDDAISAYLQSVKIKPNFHQGWYNLACNYSIIKDLKRSLECLQNAINKNDNTTDYQRIIRNEPDFDNIKHLPEFNKILKTFFK